MGSGVWGLDLGDACLVRGFLSQAPPRCRRPEAFGLKAFDLKSFGLQAFDLKSFGLKAFDLKPFDSKAFDLESSNYAAPCEITVRRAQSSAAVDATGVPRSQENAHPPRRPTVGS